MISIIAAVGKNNELGKNNSLLWHLPSDLSFFKKTTLGYPVIMGKNTYLSIGRPLPGRENIVISSTLEDDKVTIYKSIDDCIDNIKDKDVFVIGGASIYKIFINLADNIYLTEINKEDNEADVFFPLFNKGEYDKEVIAKNSDNNIEFEHVLYRRKR